MNRSWNVVLEPISERLRDDEELKIISETNAMIYHQETGTTALIMEVWKVDPIEGSPETKEEDRYVKYASDHFVREDYSVDLDDEGWIWYDCITKEQL